MGLYNFQQRFVPFILAGTKKHTIRDKRAHPDKPGNTLHLYSGLRTKEARLIARVECVKVEDIQITPVLRIKPCNVAVLINGILLSADEVERLACADGFSSFYEMVKFWKTPKDRLPFRGDIIHWKGK